MSVGQLNLWSKSFGTGPVKAPCRAAAAVCRVDIDLQAAGVAAEASRLCTGVLATLWSKHYSHMI